MWGLTPDLLRRQLVRSPSLAPLPLWRGSAKGLLKRDTAREPMLQSLFEPFARVHPRVRGNRLPTIREGVPWSNVATQRQGVTNDKPHHECIDFIVS
jgi:hypothetical protein